MKTTILTVAAVLSTPLFAFAEETCDATYITNRGDNLKNIVTQAYAAPMLPIVLARNPHIASESQVLDAGVEVYLPCLHNLPQFTPQLSEADGRKVLKVALR